MGVCVNWYLQVCKVICTFISCASNTAYMFEITYFVLMLSKEPKREI